MAEETLKDKTAKGLIWGGLSNFIQQVIGMIFGIIIARILDVGDYGLIAMLSVFSAIATTIIESGFTVALINKKDAEHKDYNAVFWCSVFAGLTVYIILFFAAPLIAAFFKQPVLTALARLTFLGFVISSVGIVHNAILLKNMKMKQMGIINIAGVCTSGIVGLILALNGFAYWGLAVQPIAFLLISVILRWHFSKWRPSFKIDFSPLKTMIGFSSKVFLNNIIYQIYGHTFSALLGKLFNKNLLGCYAQGLKWTTITGAVVTGMIAPIVQPLFAQVKDDSERQLRVFRKMTRFTAFTAFPIFTGLAFIAPEFIWIALGEKWLGSVIFLQIMCIWALLSPFTFLYIITLLSHGKSGTYLTGNIITVGFQFLLFVILYFMHAPITWFALCYSVSCFPLMICTHFHAKKLIGIKLIYLIKDIFPYMTITAGAVLFTMLILSSIENIYLLFAGKILLTAGIYFTVLYIFDSKILKESITLLKNKMNLS